MKIRDLKNLNGSWDVYGDYADEIAVAFDNDGTEWLTEEGKEYFKDILDVKVRVTNDMILVDTESVMTHDEKEDTDTYHFWNYDGYPPLVKKIADLFWGYAGYVDEKLYNKWFVA